MNDKQRQWVYTAFRFGGGFIKSFAEACMRADEQNLALLEPVLDQMVAKYPYYSSEPAPQLSETEKQD